MLRLLLVTACLLLPAAATAQEQSRPLSLPPESLAQWYPPANQRQVWLHTMFSLRRSMQAVTEYNALEEHAMSARWAARFAEEYKKLAEMVPEWQDEIENEAADQLVTAATAGDARGVNGALRKLGTSCRSCHNENRPMAILKHRVPDYADIMIENDDTMEITPFAEHMDSLGALMNRIKIAQEDGLHERARAAGERFIAGTRDLGSSCQSCHRDDAARDYIFSGQVMQALEQLDDGLRTENAESSNQALGTLGAFACGRCHSIHKTPAELRRALLPAR